MQEGRRGLPLITLRHLVPVVEGLWFGHRLTMHLLRGRLQDGRGSEIQSTAGRGAVAVFRGRVELSGRLRVPVIFARPGRVPSVACSY